MYLDGVPLKRVTYVVMVCWLTISTPGIVQGLTRARHKRQGSLPLRSLTSPDHHTKVRPIPVHTPPIRKVVDPHTASNAMNAVFRLKQSKTVVPSNTNPKIVNNIPLKSNTPSTEMPDILYEQYRKYLLENLYRLRDVRARTSTRTSNRKVAISPRRVQIKEPFPSTGLAMTSSHNSAKSSYIPVNTNSYSPVQISSQNPSQNSLLNSPGNSVSNPGNSLLNPDQNALNNPHGIGGSIQNPLGNSISIPAENSINNPFGTGGVIQNAPENSVLISLANAINNPTGYSIPNPAENSLQNPTLNSVNNPTGHTSIQNSIRNPYGQPAPQAIQHQPSTSSSNPLVDTGPVILSLSQPAHNTHDTWNLPRPPPVHPDQFPYGILLKAQISRTNHRGPSILPKKFSAPQDVETPCGLRYTPEYKSRIVTPRPSPPPPPPPPPVRPRPWWMPQPVIDLDLPDQPDIAAIPPQNMGPTDLGCYCDRSVDCSRGPSQFYGSPYNSQCEHLGFGFVCCCHGASDLDPRRPFRGRRPRPYAGPLVTDGRSRPFMYVRH